MNFIKAIAMLLAVTVLALFGGSVVEEVEDEINES